MSLAEQGAYRNLLDEVVLREGGIIPEESLAKASGDAVLWPRLAKTVLRWMRKTEGGWTNDTALEVKEKSEQVSEKQRLRVAARWKRKRRRDTAVPTAVIHKPIPDLYHPDPSPDQDKRPDTYTPPTPPGEAPASAGRSRRRPTRGDAADFERYDTPEAREVIRLRHELVGGTQDATLPKLRSAGRFLEAGFTVEHARLVFTRIRDAPNDGRSLSTFCCYQNTAFEYSLRPEVAQKILDETPQSIRQRGNSGIKDKAEKLDDYGRKLMLQAIAAGVALKLGDPPPSSEEQAAARTELAKMPGPLPGASLGLVKGVS